MIQNPVNNFAALLEPQTQQRTVGLAALLQGLNALQLRAIPARGKSLVNLALRTVRTGAGTLCDHGFLILQHHYARARFGSGQRSHGTSGTSAQHANFGFDSFGYVGFFDALRQRYAV